MLNVMQKKPSENSEHLSILKEAELLNTRKTIDPAIKQLIADLNEAGFETQSSCQGKRSTLDVRHHSHCNHAFIGFMPDGLLGFKTKAKSLGLFVLEGDGITSLDGSETTWDDIFHKNKAFESKVRQLFNI